MSETHEEPVLTSTTPSLGERLRQAREAKKYSIAEVAAQLRLTRDIVSYLENQEWDRLNGRTYARGYFASYVKFLGLPYEEMLAVFNLEYTATEPAVNLRQQRHATEDNQFPWFMLALLAIVLLVAWLGYQQWQTTQMAQQNAVVSSELSQESEQDSFAESIVEPLESNQEPVLELSESVADTEALSEADEPLMSDRSDDVTAVESETITPAETTAEAEQAQAANAVPTLRMTFSGECWVEVTNGNAKVLVSQVMQADDTIELPAGQALNILLGRADAATVYFDNQQVDLKPHTQGDVARLTLGVES